MPIDDVKGSSPIILSRKKQVVEQKLLRPSDMIEQVFTTDQGEPFGFKGREYLYPAYDTDWRYIVIMSSRQAEKSTYVAKKIGVQMFMNSNERILYATASHQHLKTFSRDKFKQQFVNNPMLAEEYLDSKKTFTIQEAQLSNNSILFLRAIDKNPDSTRGLTARILYFDEVQSIDDKSIPIAIETTQSYADDACFGYLGTPLTPGNILTVRYENSWQMEWIIRCMSCGKDNPRLGIEHIDKDKPYLFCVHCGRQMQAWNGRWIKMNPKGRYPGFRISRLMTPTCTWKTEAQSGVLDKFDGPNAYPYHQFVNEVLGLPEGVGRTPITMEELFSNCEDYDFIDPMKPESWVHSVNVVGTVDWAWSSKDHGESFTIYALWTPRQGRMQCIYAKRQIGPQYADPEFGLNEMAQAFARTRCKFVGTDFGVGHKENVRLRERLKDRGCRIVEFLYAGTYKRQHWNDEDKRYHVGKVESLDLTFSALTRGKYMFPRASQAEMYLKDILNVFVEYNPDTKRRKYEHAGLGPDDFLHLCNYARMILEVFTGQI